MPAQATNLTDIVQALVRTVDRANQSAESAATGALSYAIAEVDLAIPIVSLELPAESKGGEIGLRLATADQSTPHSLRLTLRTVPKVEIEKVNLRDTAIQATTVMSPDDAARLNRAGVVTLGDLAGADSKDLAGKTGLGAGVIAKAIESAKAMLAGS